MKNLYVDFEFNAVSEPELNLVSGSVLINKKMNEFWLHKNQGSKEKLKNLLLEHKDRNFVAYQVEAEARSLLALGLNPLKFKWIDLYLEYRMLLNHNNEMSYGKQLIKGRVNILNPPRISGV